MLMPPAPPVHLLYLLWMKAFARVGEKSKRKDADAGAGAGAGEYSLRLHKPRRSP